MTPAPQSAASTPSSDGESMIIEGLPTYTVHVDVEYVFYEDHLWKKIKRDRGDTMWRWSVYDEYIRGVEATGFADTPQEAADCIKGALERWEVQYGRR